MDANKKRILVTVINGLIVLANLILQYLNGNGGGASDVALGCLATYAALV